jgi:hypothetical protein
MIRDLWPTALILIAGLTISLSACRRWEARRIKKGFQAVNAEPAKHLADNQWKDFPTLGIPDAWKTPAGKDGDVLCLATDFMGPHLFRFRQGRHFITDIAETKSCDQ